MDSESAFGVDIIHHCTVIISPGLSPGGIPLTGIYITGETEKGLRVPS